MATLTATLNLSNIQFQPLSVGTSPYTMTLATNPAPSSGITLTSGTNQLTIKADDGDTVILTYLLTNDTNNILLGAFFYANGGNITGQATFPQIDNSIDAATNVSTMVVTDIFSDDPNGTSFGYSYGILIQNDLTNNDPGAGDSNAIGLLDPAIENDYSDGNVEPAPHH